MEDETSLGSSSSQEKEENGSSTVSPKNLKYSNPDSSGDDPSSRGSSDSKIRSLTFEDSWIGVGIRKLGNNCLLNSALQCFTHTVPLLEGLQSCRHPFPCPRSKGDFCVFCSVRDHIDHALSSYFPVSPHEIGAHLDKLSSEFKRYEQADAHEFLQYMLEKLDECFKNFEDDNFVKQIFEGRLRSQRKCCSCGHFSSKVEPAIYLSLDVETVDVLLDALALYFQEETVGEFGDKLTCENCKLEVLKESKTTENKAPTIAIFHLKRFQYTFSGTKKITKDVDYPLELDLKPFLSNLDDPQGYEYNLYAFIEHLGNEARLGHYICYIRTSDDSWYLVDDTDIRAVSEEHALSKDAYILFYAKELPWFSDFMMTQTVGPFSDRITRMSSPTSVLDGTKRDLEQSSTSETGCERTSEDLTSDDESKPCVDVEHSDTGKVNSDDIIDNGVGASPQAPLRSPLDSEKVVHGSSPSTPLGYPSFDADIELLSALREMIQNSIGPKIDGRHQRGIKVDKLMETAETKCLSRCLRRSVSTSCLPLSRKCQSDDTFHLSKRLRMLDDGGAAGSSMLSPIRSHCSSPL